MMRKTAEMGDGLMSSNFTSEDINLIATYRDLGEAKEAMSNLLSRSQVGDKIDPRKFSIL